MCPCWVWNWILFLVTLVLLGALVLQRRSRMTEAFEATEQPDLNKMLSRVQGLLDKVATPEVLAHMTTVMNKDPGELARLYAEKQKGITTS